MLKASGVEQVPGAGFEPARAFEVPQDFKSCASANFAIPAGRQLRIKNKEWKNGLSKSNTILRDIYLMSQRDTKFFIFNFSLLFMRRGAESNRRIQVLQTRALPLCYRAELQ